MINWHSVDEYPNVSQVIVNDFGKLKISGIQKGKPAPYEWITIDEVFKELDCLDFIVEQFSSWETDSGCPDHCPFKDESIKAMISKGLSKENAIKLSIDTSYVDDDGHRCSDFCGMKGREAECCAEDYRQKFYKSN